MEFERQTKKHGLICHISEDCVLQVAVYTFLEELTGSRAPSDQAKALACQAAEHQFAGRAIYVGARKGGHGNVIRQKIMIFRCH